MSRSMATNLTEGNVAGLLLRFAFDMERLAKALSAIAACEAKPQFSIAFTVEDTQAVKDELLRSVTANAKHKAEVLCEASGVKLGRLLSVEYDWRERNLYSATEYNAMDGRAGGAGMLRTMSAKAVDIEPEDIKIKDSAGFVWEIL